MAVDISEYLDIIAGESDGEEVILAVHDASLALGTDTYKTADIEELLENIKTKVFGIEIRMDIYEILKRLSEAAPTPPTPPTPPTDYAPFSLHPVIIQGTSGTFFAPIATPFGIANKVISYNNGVAYYTTGNNGAAATTLTIPDPRVTCIPAKSLAIIMYRSAKTFTASGYTLLADSQVMSTSGVSMQQVSVYQKSILPTETAGSLTVSQTDDARLDIINAIISGNNVTLTLVDNALVESVPYTPPAKTTKRRLYIVSSINAKNSDTKTPYFNLGVSGLAMRSDGFNRLKVYYDYDPAVNLTPTLTYSNDYIANSIALMAFDVDGTF